MTDGSAHQSPLFSPLSEIETKQSTHPFFILSIRQSTNDDFTEHDDEIGDLKLISSDKVASLNNQMVRRISSCLTCNVRFVALANASNCFTCNDFVVVPTNSTVKENQVYASPEASREAVIEIIESDEYDCSEAGGSEGGDDVHCTQFGDDEDDNAEDVQDTSSIVHHIDLETVSATVPDTTKPSPSEFSRPVSITPNSADICFICGASLKNLKRRTDHIKRCSKKHSISGRDVKANTDMDAFEHNDSVVATPTASTNPYMQPSSWHGDANLALRLASDDPSNTPKTIESPKGQASKQTSLSSFLSNPARSLTNVLIAGARRMTKVAEVKKASAEQPNSKQTTFAGRKRGRGSWNNGNKYANRTCPMFKKIPGTDFVCDGFYYAKSSLTNNYFLTHFHSDHYGGISRGWSEGTIYCSLPTATLVAQQIGVDKKYLHPIPMNTPTVIASKGKPVTVTLLDANHCPGAIMFLFEVGKRQILHVGDFRWNRAFMMQQDLLRNFASEQTILDDLFLDTTYCNPKYSLPSQQETIGAIISLFEKEIARCRESNTKTLHLFGAYTIGKEKMYLSVAERFNLKVYVDKSRYRILSALEWPKERMALLTTSMEDAYIWVIPLGHINMKKLPEYFPIANNKPFAKQYDQIIGYRPTGWSMGSKPSSSLVSTRYSGNIGIHSVPYSEHSSFPELVDCLACLKPQRIVPTVSVGKSDEQVQTLLKALREKQTTISFGTTH